MQYSNARLPRRHVWITALVVALVLSLSFAHAVLAETIQAAEGPWTMSMQVVTQNCCGATDYYAVGSTSSSGCCTSLEINTRGYNNSTGWHLVDSDTCDAFPGSSCTSRRVAYDASDNNPPATASYGATEHDIWYPVDSGGGGGTFYDYFTSTDGAHSTHSCVWTAGC